MQYRQVPKNGDSLSVLGFGAMRLPTRRGRIDEERASRQIRSAIDAGVNYIDTAFMYGESERILGDVLKDGYREKVKLATKLPPWHLTKPEDMETILNDQLKKLQTDHIDYYLLHSLDANNWKKLLDFGVFEFLEKAKAAGKIINIGFSFHGDRKTFKEIIDSYDWVFCQIQYNFIDENTQAGKDGLLYAASKNIAVIVMEPLRGGMLTQKIPDDAKKIYTSAKIKRSPAEWALRWVLNHPEVTVVLSGMNDELHIAENITTCEDAFAGVMTPDELSIVEEVKGIYLRLMKVGCTGCAYCMPCPFGVNIPQCLSFYNQYHMAGNRMMTRGMYGIQLMGGLGGTPAHASLCRNCGKCVSLCPQHIPIPDELKKASKNLDGLRTRALIPIIRMIFSRRKIND
ncbi:MAG TPA: aldo/keto reductase [Methanospirillum sp.]|uniref:aldo/keto reductase n=1 Tax=Methanospirillum sp. TaxID=45200 RepID=UPI002B6E195C|nr:aldo/keto reductase [Methanospirillum sp.]HWQ63788.1 aldo/keto reductase [Methanospirillum sp.]